MANATRRPSRQVGPARPRCLKGCRGRSHHLTLPKKGDGCPPFPCPESPPACPAPLGPSPESPLKTPCRTFAAWPGPPGTSSSWRRGWWAGERPWRQGGVGEDDVHRHVLGGGQFGPAPGAARIELRVPLGQILGDFFLRDSVPSSRRTCSSTQALAPQQLQGPAPWRRVGYSPGTALKPLERRVWITPHRTKSSFWPRSFP